MVANTCLVNKLPNQMHMIDIQFGSLMTPVMSSKCSRALMQSY